MKREDLNITHEVIELCSRKHENLTGVIMPEFPSLVPTEKLTGASAS